MNDKYIPKIFFQENLFYFFLVITVLLLLPGCSYDGSTNGDSTEGISVFLEEYPQLYESLIHRNGDEILPFVSNSSPEIRNYAWAALYHSDAVVDREMLELVRKADEEAGWMMPGYHEMDKNMLQQV